MAKSKLHEVDMTHGPLMGKIISFAIPLMLSSLAQTLFTTVDTVVVGRYAGSEALAAVGSTGTFIGLFTNFFIGLSLGVNVCIAQSYAAKDKEGVFRLVHTSVTSALLFGLFVLVLGEVISSAALGWMGTPDNVFDLSLLYVRIRFIGAPVVVLYNFIAAIFRSIGDTRRPLIYQLVAGVLNAALNVYLVLVWDMGVAGVAIATVFSQLVSCVCMIVSLLRTESCCKLHPAKLTIHWSSLWKILKIGVPTGVQSMLVALSNVLIQSSVNTFGSVTMAAYSVICSIRGYVFLVVHSFSQAATSFVGQNFGVRDFKRIRQVSRDCLILVLTSGFMVGFAFTLFAPQVAGLFTTDEAVIEITASVMFLTVGPYVLYGIMDMYGSCMRGMNHSLTPMLFNFFGTVVLRILWVFFVFPHYNTLVNLLISYPLSWSLTAFLQFLAYRACFRKEQRLAASQTV